jgi:hypothetical protein
MEERVQEDGALYHTFCQCPALAANKMKILAVRG